MCRAHEASRETFSKGAPAGQVHPIEWVTQRERRRFLFSEEIVDAAQAGQASLAGLEIFLHN